MTRKPVFNRAVTALLVAVALCSSEAVAAQEEFSWQTAPTEAFQAQLTIKEAILRAFARNPKIARPRRKSRSGKPISLKRKARGFRKSR